MLFCIVALVPTLAGQTSEPIRLIGVGSTSPLPAFSRLLPAFEKTHVNLLASYLPYGSERGMEMVATGTADFAASEAQPPVHWSAGNDMPLLFFPMLVGAVVPAYNLPGLTQPLKFTAKSLADIYLGKITRWDDAELAAANRTVTLPAVSIVVVHSAAGRGSTYIWTDYLCKISNEWKMRVGKGLSVRWPVGEEVDANGNVARMVKNTPFSLAFVDLGYGLRAQVSLGLVQNAAGNFVAADTASVAAAAAAATKAVPPDFRYSITNPGGALSYPIASFSWLVIAKKSGPPGKQQALKTFMHWMLSDGQLYIPDAGFTAVPQEIAGHELKAIDNLQ
jgi:phosphate transport system substrate-binding protein